MTTTGITKLDNIPVDTVSEVAFSEKAPYVCAVSWDNSVRVWQINPSNLQGTNTVSYECQTRDALTHCCWCEDDTIFYGSARGEISNFSIKETKPTVIAQHEGVCTGVRYSAKKSSVISCGTDEKILITDTRSKSKTEIKAPGKISCFDTDSEGNMIFLAVGNAVYFADARKPTVKPNRITHLKVTSKITSIAVSSSGNGFLVGTVTGQVEADFENGKKDIVFPCHMNDADGSVYSSNCVALSSEKLGGASAGSDGKIAFFNLSTGKKTGEKPAMTGGTVMPVTAIAFSPRGGFLAYACGYDWARGADEMKRPEAPPIEIGLRRLTGADIG